MIGYYEAPDGENEALFIADRISKYLRAAGSEEDLPRCAVLYRTNSQSRLVEEALRRYQIQYHMVGGFSFYDRAEVKDILSYMKLVQNPNDSIALNRVVNSPPRGIGKTTMETLERIALTTGISTWDALAHAIEDRLLPARALTALAGFKRLIEDARAMLGPDFAQKLTQDVASDFDGDTGFDPSAFSSDEPREEQVEFPPVEGNGADTSFDTSFNFGFDFGPSEEISTIAPENAAAKATSPDVEFDAVSFNPFAPVVLKKSAAEGKSASPGERAAAAIMSDEKPAFANPAIPQRFLNSSNSSTTAAATFAPSKKRPRPRASPASRT